MTLESWFFIGLGLTVGGLTTFLVLRRRISGLSSRLKLLTEKSDTVTHKLTTQGMTIRSQVLELRTALQERERLIAGISHEFRTPLTLIHAVCQQLQHSDVDLGYAKTQIDYSTTRLQKLVDNLLAMAEPASTPENACDVGMRIHTLLKAFESSTAAANLTIETHIESGCRALITPDHIDQIMGNLITNAIKYAAPGVLQIQVTQQDQKVCIDVADNGPGIANELLPHLFDPFVRGAHSSAQPGSGLGLALVEEMIQRANGTIHVENNDGLSFSIAFPASDAVPSEGAFEPNLTAVQEPTAPEQPSIAENSSDQAPRMIIVEDDAPLRHFLEQTFANDFQVTGTSDAQEAYNSIQEQVPDIVISDLHLPDKDGIWLTRKIKAHPLSAHIPVIILTAQSGGAHQQRALEALADDYINKPFDVSALSDKVQSLLKIRACLQQHYARAALGVENFSSPMKDVFLERLLTTLQTTPQLSVQELAERVHLSERQLQRKLQALTGKSPSQFIQKYKLNRAAQLLDNGIPATQAGLDAGFKDYSHFSRLFKQSFGMPPGRYAHRQEAEQPFLTG